MTAVCKAVVLAALVCAGSSQAKAQVVAGVPGAMERQIMIQSRASPPITLRVLRANGSRCGPDVKATFGNRIRVGICGVRATVAMHDSVAVVLMPVEQGRVYEIRPRGDRWSFVRATDIY
jgi:hypothetical protein